MSGTYRADYVGAAGLAQLASQGDSWRAADPEGFHAQIESVVIGRTRLVLARSTAVRVGFDPSLPTIAGSVFCTFVIEGTAVGHHDGSALTLRPNSMLLVHGGPPFHIDSAQPISWASLWVPLDLLRSDTAAVLQRVCAISFDDNATARGVTAIVRSLLGRGGLEGPPPIPDREAVALQRVLVAQLDTLVLREMGRRTTAARAGRDLYAELRHLLGADLSIRTPTTAEAAKMLAVSRADLALALSAHNTNPGEMLREERLDALASDLRDTTNAGSLASLTGTSGFAGHTQAARHFKARFGLTMGDYRTMMRL